MIGLLLYLLACLAVPLLWGVLVARRLRREDEAAAARPPEPEYEI